MLLFKNGVDSAGLKREMYPALHAANECFGAVGLDCVVTSIQDGRHQHQRHYQGLAFDLRTRHIEPPVTDEGLAENIRRKLMLMFGWKQYDVVVESDHLHVEYDPKVDGVHLVNLSLGEIPSERFVA